MWRLAFREAYSQAKTSPANMVVVLDGGRLHGDRINLIAVLAGANLESAPEQGVRPRFAASLLFLIGKKQAVQLQVSVPETGETLTAREIEVLRLIAAGSGNSAIADQLYISVNTVKRHVANLLDKLGASSRTQAAVRAAELGII